MRYQKLTFTGLLLAASSCLLGVGTASAQNAKSYVSSTGNDAFACTFAQPCQHFQRGHDQTNPNGELYAIDAVADYGTLTITKGITIYAPADDAASRPSISIASGSAVTVNAPSNSTVTLVNLQLDGQGTADNGVLFNAGFELQVYGGSFKRFGGAAPNGFGIKFAPSAFSRLYVSGSNLSGNGTASTGGGVQVNPQSSGSGFVKLQGVASYLNAFGLAIDTSGSTGGVNATIRRADVQFNRQDGIVVVGGAPVGLLVDDSSVFGNAGNGVRAISNATVRLFNSSVLGNGVGVVDVSGGSMLSYGNNNIDGNGTNGTATIIPQK
jgi:hypothetical protein